MSKIFGQIVPYEITLVNLINPMHSKWSQKVGNTAKIGNAIIDQEQIYEVCFRKSH